LLLSNNTIEHHLQSFGSRYVPVNRYVAEARESSKFRSLLLGPIIMKRWTNSYQDMQEVYKAVEQAFRM